MIKRIPNKIEQSHWVQKLSKELEVKEEDVAEELKKVPPTTFGPEVVVDEAVASSPPFAKAWVEEEPSIIKSGGGRKELLEERLTTLILRSPENLENLSQEDFQFFSPQIGKILTLLKENPKVETIKTPPELTDLLNYLLLKAEIETIEADFKEEFKNCFREIKSLEIKNKLAQISKEIKAAEEGRDSKKIEKLIREFNQLAKEIV